MQTIHSTAQGNSILSKTAVGHPSAEVAASVIATAPAPSPGKSDMITPTEGQAAPTKTASPQLPLIGRRIGLDPGHGPLNDLGAVLIDPNTGELILSEAEFNLEIALRVRDILLARRASVVLTRESADTFTAPWPADTNGDGIVGASGDELQERVDILNNFHAEVFMSIHANGGTSEQSAKEDLQVLYCGSSECAFPAESKELAHLVLGQLETHLASATGTTYGGEALNDLSVDSSDPPLHLFVLGPVSPPRHVRATNMPGVLAESLYITRPTQATLLKEGSVRQAIALAYADALQAYLTGHSALGQ